MKSVKYFVVTASLVWALMTAAPCIGEQIEIISFVYPPYTYGDGSGMLEKIVTRVATDNKITIKWSFYPRKRAYKQYSDRLNTTLFLGQSEYFPDLLSRIKAQPLLNFRTVFVYMKEKFPDIVYSSISDLKGKRVGVTLGSVYIPYFNKQGLLVDPAELEQNIRKLVIGRLDFWHTVDVTAINMVDKYFPDKKSNIGFLEEAILKAELIVIRESELEPVFDRFTTRFKEIINDGTYKVILESFYGNGNVPERVMVQ